MHLPLSASSSAGSLPLKSSFLSNSVENKLLHASTAVTTSLSLSDCKKPWKLLGMAACLHSSVFIHTWRNSNTSKMSLACFLLSSILSIVLFRSIFAVLALGCDFFPNFTFRFWEGAMLVSRREEGRCFFFYSHFGMWHIAAPIGHL